MAHLKSRWMLVALASSAAALPFVLDACDGDDTPARTLPDASSNLPDTLQPQDSSNDAPAVDAGQLAKVLLVHAAPDVPAIRVCFAIGTKADGSDAAIVPIPPLPDRTVAPQPYPGIFPGTGGAFPDLGVDLSTKVVVPYVIIASAVKDDVRSDAGPPKLSCSELLSNGPNSLPGTSYFQLPLIAAGTFATGKTLLLAATGCLPNEPQGAALCGASYDTNLGNVSLRRYELDRVVAAGPSQIGVQVAHLSSAVEGKLQGAVNANLIGPVDAAAGDAFVEPVANNLHYGTLAPMPASVVGLGDPLQTAFFASVQNPDSGAPLANVVVPLPLVYQITTGQSAGADQYFKAGANYAFVILGDPAEPTFTDAGVFNGKSLHFLGLPSDPPTQKYP